MVWQIVKKQALLLWRNPVQLFLLLGLPMLLISILGTALSPFMDGGTPQIKIKLALIEHGDQTEEIEQFISELENKDWPLDVVAEIESNVLRFAPLEILKTVFGSGERKDMVHVVEKEDAEKEKLLNDDSYTAVIEVPAGFTHETLQAMFFDEGTRPKLTLYQNEGAPIGASIVHSMLEQFQKQLTLSTYLSRNGINYVALQQQLEASLTDEMKTINQKEAVTTRSYYTVGMAVMNVFFIASAISTMAYTEKKMHVFDRMILGNVARWAYFTGVFLSGTLFGLLQLLIIFAL